MAAIKLEPAQLEILKNLRREIHQNPEQSHQEVKTAERIVHWAKKYLPGFSIHTGLGGTGVLLVMDSGHPGQRLLFRAELDALPIEEENEDLPHRSKNPGTSHKCGHDGHMVMVCGLGMLVEKYPPKNGAVGLIFQPAEEVGEGAEMVVKSQAFKSFNADACFALHNLPEHPMGTVLVKSGSMCMASTGLWLRFRGKTSHAAEPFAGTSPLPVLSELMPYLQYEEIKDSPHKISTLVHARLGDPAFGTTPGVMNLALTLRSETDDALEEMIDELLEKAKKFSEKHGVKMESERVEPFAAVVNRQSDVDCVLQAAKSMQCEVEMMKTPTRWSEDVGEMMKLTSGALFCLGSGEETPVLHHPTYDFPDELTPIGSGLFFEIYRDKMGLD
ncbi:MAG: amidohydrolase [Cryomorphaceae bacterium]|nr:amidohydrolase [Cryomorphaceae bacterium]